MKNIFKNIFGTKIKEPFNIGDIVVIDYSIRSDYYEQFNEHIKSTKLKVCQIFLNEACSKHEKRLIYDVWVEALNGDKVSLFKGTPTRVDWSSDDVFKKINE